MAKKYLVTYNSRDAVFIVHRQEHGLPAMHFRMHKSGLHVYYPKKGKEFIFIETVAGNMEGFSKREIKRAYDAAKLYVRLIYPSEKDFNWIVMSNSIKNCTVTPRDVEVA